MKARLAIIEWGDAWGSNSWESRERILDETNRKPAIIRTVGWIVSSNKEGVNVLCSVSQHGSSPLNCFITRGMIRDIEYLGAKHAIDY